MNASRTILLRPRALPKGGTTGMHRQSQNNFFVASSTTRNTPGASSSSSSKPLFARPSAKAIQLLLGNIGVGHRASLHTIEGMIRNKDHGDADDVIDLIAQIRSM
ncbi:hypothetical protein ACHAW5_002188 [Stephanodiscus triporus]|uniref:Uncharacterized protein n=1 Tax=Stephanodiscus triporus TaxID=2934178 RepID=A0ABD3NIH2_9STRA